MSKGTITFHRDSGSEVRNLAKAEMWVTSMPSESEGREFDCEIVLWFEAPDRPINGVMSPAEFTPVNGEIRIKVDEFLEDMLVGSTFSIPRGYDRATDEYLTRLYYFDHLEIDEVEIKVLQYCDGGYWVQLVGQCELDTYGRTGPPSKVVIDGRVDWSVDGEA